jgi:hypothetical protein
MASAGAECVSWMQQVGVPSLQFGNPISDVVRRKSIANTDIRGSSQVHRDLEHRCL